MGISFLNYFLNSFYFLSTESYTCQRCALNTCDSSTQRSCETSQSCFSYRQELFSTGTLPGPAGLSQCRGPCHFPVLVLSQPLPPTWSGDARIVTNVGHLPSVGHLWTNAETQVNTWTRGTEPSQWPLAQRHCLWFQPTLPGLFHAGQPLTFVEEKGCAERQCVPLNFSATLGANMMFAYGHQCCSSELCNTGDFQGELEFLPLLTELEPPPPEKLPVIWLL